MIAQLSSHPYQSTYKIWKQSDKDLLSCRENDEVSADVDTNAAAQRWLNRSAWVHSFGGYNYMYATPIQSTSMCYLGGLFIRFLRIL